MTTYATINGNTYSDGTSNEGTGIRYLDNSGHWQHFLPLVTDVVTVTNNFAGNAAAIAANTSLAQTAANQSINAKTQAETARDQAVAGLGAADQSTNLVQLAYGIARALSQAAHAIKRTVDILTFCTQTGTATVTQSASSAHFRNYASVAVTLPKPFLTTDYQVVVEAEAAAPFLGAEGQIIVSARATNGFVLLITGSATSATLRWKVIHPNAK